MTGGMPVAVETLALGLQRPETVAWDPTTSSLVCSGGAGQVYRIDPFSGAVTEIARTRGSVLGLAIDGAGRAGDVADLTSGTDGPAFVVPNFTAFAPGGHLYVSDSGRLDAEDGYVMLLRSDGSFEPAGDGPCGYPNGLAVDARRE